MKTEYLINIDTSKSNTTTISAFNHKLMSNALLQIEKNTIRFESIVADYALNIHHIEDSDYIYFHLILQIDDKFEDIENNNFRSFLQLLKEIRKTVRTNDSKSNIEILWDDVSFALSEKIYPEINKIENLMRKLITQFLCINVGERWKKENIPSSINKSKNKGKNINEDNGILYQLDFIELSQFLFDEYSTLNLKDIEKSCTKKTISLDELKGYISQSNWDRYFKDIVDANGETLKKDWERLYEYRCKIAHNNYFSLDDYEKTTKIIKDLLPKLECAINNLNKIKIDNKEKTNISDNYASISNDFTKDFLIKYNNLLRSLEEKISYNHNRLNKISLSSHKIIEESLNKKVITDEQYKKIKELNFYRNRLVHSGNEYDYNYDNIKILLKYIDEITSSLE